MTVTFKEFQEKIPDSVELIEYVSATKPCVFRCKKCGTIYSNRIARWLVVTKTVCDCEGPQQSTPLKEHLAKLKANGIRLQPLNYYRLGKACDYKCRDCGHVFEAKPSTVQAGKHVCPECKDVKRVSQYEKFLKEEFPNIRLREPYVDARTPIKHKCKCGYSWLSKPFVSRGRVRKAGCPKCDHRHGSVKRSHEWYVERLASVTADIAVKEKYKGSEVAIKHKCLKCNHIFSRPPHYFLTGHGCVKCVYDRAFKTRRSVEFGGRTVEVQGYEDLALGYLESRLSPELLYVSVAEGKPTLQYSHHGKVRTYIPDFYYAKRNRIIEVKSPYTFLREFSKNVSKAKVCLESGYDFQLLLLTANRNKRKERWIDRVIKLPKNWYDMKKREIQKFISLETQ